MIQSKFVPIISTYTKQRVNGLLTLTYIDCAGEAVLSRQVSMNEGWLPFRVRVKLAARALKREYAVIAALRGEEF